MNSLCRQTPNAQRPWRIFAIAAILSTGVLQGANRTWNSGGADANWSTGANWGGTAPIAGDTLTFGSGATVILNNDFTAFTNFDRLEFNGPAPAYTLNGNPITLGGNIDAGTNANNPMTINIELRLSGTRVINVGASDNFTLNGVISQDSAGRIFRKGGDGVLTLNGNNSFSGGFELANGTLKLGNDGALGSGEFRVTGGATIQAADATPRTFTNAITLQSGQTITFGTGGDLKFGSMTLGGDRTVIIQNSRVTVSSLEQDASGHKLTKDGSGSLIVLGDRNYTGNTTVDEGVLAIGGEFNASVGNLQFGSTGEPGGVLAIRGSYTRALGTSSGQVQWHSSGGGGGFAAYGPNGTWGHSDNNLIVNIGSGTSLVWNSTTSFVLSDDTLKLGAAVANGTVTFQNAISFNGAVRTIEVARSASAPTSGVDAILSGVLSGTGASGMTKTGAGILSLEGSSANTYAGVTTVSAGELHLNKTAGVDAIAGNVLINGGTLRLLASNQIKDTSTINMTSGAFHLNGQTETVTSFTNSGGTFTTGAGRLTGTGATVTWSGGTNTINDGGLVEDAHIVISGGTNTVEGGATGGILRLNSSGAGLEMSNGATLTLNSDNAVAGKLVLRGNVSVSGNSTVTIASGLGNANQGTIDLDGGTRTFNVANGTAATDFAVGAVLSNGGVTKAGAGTMQVTANNTYTGATTINGGTVEVAGTSGALSGTTSVTVNSGGTLLLSGSGGQSQINDSAGVTLNGGTIQLGANGMTETVGVLTLSSSSVIDFGTLTGTNNLIFADSSAATWAGTLSIWNWTRGTDHLYFGSVANSGLTNAQKGQVVFYSDSGSTSLGNAFFGPGDGEVSPVPEPSTVFAGMVLVAMMAYRERRWFLRCRDARSGAQPLSA